MSGILWDTSRSINEKFWCAVHNVIAHPIMEVLYWIGLEETGEALHNWTTPKNTKNDR